MTHGLAVETLQWILDASKSFRDDRGRLLVRCRKGVCNESHPSTLGLACEASERLTGVIGRKLLGTSLKRFGDVNHRGIDGQSRLRQIIPVDAKTPDETNIKQDFLSHLSIEIPGTPPFALLIGTVHSISLRRSTRITKFRHAYQQLLRPRVRADDHSGEVGRSQMDEPQTRANRRSETDRHVGCVYLRGLRC